MTADNLLTPRQAAKLLGVHLQTLRKWDKAGSLKAIRTPGGHRRFRRSDIEVLRGLSVKEFEERVVIYCRVSSHDQKQKGDLERQAGRVSAYCAEKSYRITQIYQEVGSGMSETRPKLRRLFKLVNAHEIDRVVVEHKDRLTRFGFGLIEAYLASHGVTIEWTGQKLPKSYEEELVEDILTLMASFSARIYGRRSAINRKVQER